jgi:hypothetical protein
MPIVSRFQRVYSQLHGPGGRVEYADYQGIEERHVQIEIILVESI